MLQAFGRILLFCWLFIGVVGCAHQIDCAKIQVKNADDFLSKYVKDNAPIQSLRAEARVEQRGDKGRIKGTVWMFLKSPNQLRFDVMTQFGPAAILTSNGNQFALLDQREQKYFVGRPCPDNIAKLLGIALPAEGVVQILTGQSPVIRASESTMQCTKNGQSRITLQSSNYENNGLFQQLDFNVQASTNETHYSSTLLGASVLNRDGGREWSVKYSKFKKIVKGNQTFNLPHKITFVDHQRKIEVTIYFKSIEVNVEVPEEAFEQTFPAAMKPEEIRCPSIPEITESEQPKIESPESKPELPKPESKQGGDE